MMYFTYKY